MDNAPDPRSCLSLVTRRAALLLSDERMPRDQRERAVGAPSPTAARPARDSRDRVRAGDWRGLMQDSGANAVLRKPLLLNELAIRVGRVLRGLSLKSRSNLLGNAAGTAQP